MNVEGQVLYNPTSSANINDSSNSGISNIPITLQNLSTKMGLVALTNAQGSFQFSDVPAGDYQVVETALSPHGVSSPASFNNANLIQSITPADPLANVISNIVADATDLVSLSPNTVFITLNNSDITNIVFLDSPIQRVPLALNDYVTIGENLITEIDNGTWGTLPAGTAVQTSPPLAPYPNIDSAFTYVQYGHNAVHDGDYSVSNITVNDAFGAWWNLSIGDERNRFAIINGSNPGSPFFNQDITSLELNKEYVFSTWICNIDTNPSEVRPQLGVQISDKITNKVIFQQTLSNVFAVTNIPTWYEVGGIIKATDPNGIKVTFLSEGPAASGNDFAISYINLKELEPAPSSDITKSVNLSKASPGNILEYTILFTNRSTTPFTNITLIDPPPTNTTLVPDSLTINDKPGSWGVSNSTITLDNLSQNEQITIKYSVVVNKNAPLGLPIWNRAKIEYSFIGPHGNPRTNSILSNTAETTINAATLEIQKNVNKNIAAVGDILTYNFSIGNPGTINANNVIFKDTLSPNVEFVKGSFYINGTQSQENPTQVPVNIGYVPNGYASNLSFQVKILNANTNPIENACTSTYTYSPYTDPKLSKSGTASSNKVQTNIAIEGPAGPAGSTGPAGPPGICNCADMNSLYAQFISLYNCSCNIYNEIPLKCIFSNTNSIVIDSTNLQIIIKSLHTYVIAWSLTLDIFSPWYNIVAGICINNEFIYGSTSEFADKNPKNTKTLTLTGNFLFESLLEYNYLTLKLLNLDSAAITVINASISLFSI